MYTIYILYLLLKDNFKLHKHLFLTLYINLHGFFLHISVILCICKIIPIMNLILQISQSLVPDDETVGKMSRVW